ncbi:MAG: hypothetical protein WDM96_12805 [Lacunisphaera sp.]
MKIRTEAQLDVIEAFAFGVLHVFAGDALTGREVGEHRHHEVHLDEETPEVRQRTVNLHVLAQGRERVAGQFQVMLPGQVQHGRETDVAIEVAVQVDEGQLGIHVRRLRPQPAGW